MTVTCRESEWLGTKEYMARFHSKVERFHIPFTGSLELTHCCNLNCVHCYLGPQSDRQARSSREMDTARLHGLLDEITAAGCLNLLITGGEPLLRDDFPEIYHHAKENGLLIVVFTNGTMVTDEIIQLFHDMPPVEVEISLYGATAPTYESVTRVPGSYERCIRGITGLMERGVRVNLKTMLMTANSHEFTEMRRMAKDRGVRFRFDAAISPRLDGDKSPIGLRVPPEEAVEKEFSDPDRLVRWREFHKEFDGGKLGPVLYRCRAGRTAFHIDPHGGLQPCMMTPDIRYDISEVPFLEGWADIMPRITDRKAKAEFSCRECEKIHLCAYCPAFFRLENGADDAHSEYLCRMSELRLQHLKDCVSEGDDHEQQERI